MCLPPGLNASRGKGPGGEDEQGEKSSKFFLRTREGRSNAMHGACYMYGAKLTENVPQKRRRKDGGKV